MDLGLVINNMRGWIKKKYWFASLFALLLICIAIIVYFPQNDVSVAHQGITYAPLSDHAVEGNLENKIPETAFRQEDNGQATEEDVIYLDDDPIDDWHEMQALLRESDNANDLLIAALFSQSSGAMGVTNLNLAEELLLKALELEPDNLLVNHQIHRFCSQHDRYSICGLPYLNNIERLDPDNGHMLIQLATAYYDNGDLANALRLMQAAGSATSSSSYYAKYLKAVDESYAQHLNTGERGLQQLTFYVGVVASLSISGYNKLVDICRERIDAVDNGWEKACRASANTLSEYGLTDLDRAFGYRLKHVYGGYTQEEIESIMRDYYNERIMASQQQYVTFTPEFYASNPNPKIPDAMWEEFITTFQEQGEHQAMLFLDQSLVQQINHE